MSWGVADDGRGKLVDDTADVCRFGHPCHEADRRRFARVEQSAGEQQILGARESEVLDQPRAVLDRQRVTERPRDGHAKAGTGRAHAKVARQRDRAPGARGHAFHLGDGGHCDLLEPGETRFEAPLVGETVLARCEPGKLPDVGPGAEDAANRADDEHAYGGVAVHAFAGVNERVVHCPRHGVAGSRAIEREIRHWTGRRENRV